MASRFARISSSAKDAARRSSATMQSWQQDQRNKVTYHLKQQISAARLHSLFFSYPIILSRSKLATRALWTAMAARIHTTMDSWMKDHGFQQYIYASISWPRFGIMAAIWQHNVQAAFAGQLAAPTFEALPRPVYVGGTPADLGKHCCAPRARQAAQSIRTSCCATNRRGLKAPP